MKQLVTYLTGITLLSTALLSCTKDAHEEMRQKTTAPQVLTASVPAGQTYILSMSPGTTASIQTQALHFQTSQVATARDGSAVYQYTAQKGYAGTDEVTLQQTVTSTTAHSGGCSQNYSNEQTTTTSKTLVIKFIVAN